VKKIPALLTSAMAAAAEKTKDEVPVTVSVRTARR
jgi:hypothetical protein